MDFGWLAVGIIVVGVIGVLLIKRSSPQPKKTSKKGYASASIGRQEFASQWQRIEGIMAQPGLESSKSAMFEADKLMDAALRQNGFRGETMGERLKNARDHFGSNNPVYQGIWEAHKMRNAMAHEIGFDLPKSVAQQQLDKFKAGLQYLRVM